MPKALLCHAYGEPESLRFEDIPRPCVGAGQILVSVKAAGVNFPDTLIIQGKYQFKPGFPFSPGGEIAGIVLAAAPDVTAFRTGDAVFAPMPVPYGGFAEEVVLDADGVFRLPPGMDFDVAAAFGAAYGTSYHALRDRGKLMPGETLLVLGAAGGIGLAAVELGKKLGAKVIAAASSPEKRALCRQYGADETIAYDSADIREELARATAGRGVDVVLDPVGGSHADAVLRACNWGGRYLVVGFASGSIPRLAANILLLKGVAAIGVYWNGFARHAPADCRSELEELSRWVHGGALKPLISHRFPMRRGAEAIRLVGQRKAQGKVLLVT